MTVELIAEQNDAHPSKVHCHRNPRNPMVTAHQQVQPTLHTAPASESAPVPATIVTPDPGRARRRTATRAACLASVK